MHVKDVLKWNKKSQYNNIQIQQRHEWAQFYTGPLLDSHEFDICRRVEILSFSQKVEILPEILNSFPNVQISPKSSTYFQ